MAQFKCIRCGNQVPAENEFICECGGLYEVQHSFPDISLHLFDERLGSYESPYYSGVWRYKELIHPEIELKHIITRPEGNTNIYQREIISEYVGAKHVQIKHEGENPTGSFKDRGMTVAISMAVKNGSKVVACASTGNTSASMAAYASQAQLKGVVFVPEGEISYGKLAQALAYGSQVLQIKGNFDDAMKIVKENSKQLGFYVLNSINPWRIEGQKSIVFEMLQQRRWKPPDWIIVPAGNLGNTSAFGKALRELKQMSLIKKIPRIASVQAEGASPFYKMWSTESGEIEPEKPETIATAIKIGNPVSWEKAIRTIKETNGVVETVSDTEIMNAKAVVDASGVGCEPASAASVAGARKLVEHGVIKSDEEILCVLTGNLLKDPYTTVEYHLGNLMRIDATYMNKPTIVEPDVESISKIVNSEHSGRISLVKEVS